MNGSRRRAFRLALAVAALACAVLVSGRFDEAASQPKPEGEMRWALYVTLSPVWFDPGEVVGQLTPFWVLYAMHDALVKPMPGNRMAPSLAESWTASADPRRHECTTRGVLRGHDADGDAEARGSRCRVPARCAASPRGEAGPRAQARLLGRHRGVLPGLPGAVGPQVPLARSARAAGRQLRDRSPGAERRGDAGRLQARRELRPPHLRVRAPHRALPVRSREGETVAGRRGLPQRLRRRRAPSASPVFLAGRGDRRVSRRGGNQVEDAADGARGLLLGARDEEAQGALCLHQRALRQRRVADVGGRAEHWSLRLWRLSRHRRVVQAAGLRDRPEPALAAPAADPAAPARAGAVWAHLRIHLAERCWAAGGGARADAHQPLPVVGAPGRSAAQEAMRSGDPQDLLLAIGLGYILAGVALGPHLGLGVVTDETSIELISAIGLILLLL